MALVGDAGHPKDPMHARGIRDAFRDVELVVEAADTGLSAGRAAFAEAMAQYEERRNAAALPNYRRLCTELQFPQPSEADVRLLMAVGEDQTLADLRSWRALLEERGNALLRSSIAGVVTAVNGHQDLMTADNCGTSPFRPG